MKLNKLYIIPAFALAIAATSCSDFLDKEPTDVGTDAISFKNPSQFEQAANALYSDAFADWKTFGTDGGTDIAGIGGNGGGTAPQASDNWKKPYERLRQMNILLEKAKGYPNQDEIAVSVGTAYFFRAWQHFTLLQRYGGVPIVDHVLDTSDPVVHGPRNSRYEVVDLIIKDLKLAEEKLPSRSTINNLENRGKVTKEAAQAFLARVALFEGTWEKYVPSIGYDLDGDGSSEGAGTKKPEGYPSVDELLKLAKEKAKAVMDEADKGTFALFDACEELSYYSLFNLDDGNGNIANHTGAGKADNKEFIICNPFDFDLKRSGTNLLHQVTTWQRVNISAYLGESFLCSNGLPTHMSTSSDPRDIYANEQFGGYDTYMGEFENRDMRFIGSTYLPDRHPFAAGGEYWTPRVAAGPKYPESVFPEPSNSYNPNDPAHASKLVVYNPEIGLNSTHNNYGCRKYLPEGSGRNDNTDAADIGILRLAEVYLIYAEATCELGGGNISDSDLNISVNKLRARARIAPLSAALIAGKWDATWFNFKTGRHECHQMNMLDEIRRERMCELFGEGYRLSDLKRWGIAHINMTGQKLGRKILGTYYGNPANKVNSLQYFGEPIYNPETRPTQYGLVSEDPNDIDYGRPIATIPGNCFWSQRDYLDPIPLEQIRLNPALAQNPGW